MEELKTDRIDEAKIDLFRLFEEFWKVLPRLFFVPLALAVLFGAALGAGAAEKIAKDAAAKKEAEEKAEKLREEAILDIRSRYGKNAVMRGLDYFAESTQVERNTFIGGHRAGYGDLPADRQRGTDKNGRPLGRSADLPPDDDTSGTGKTVHGV